MAPVALTQVNRCGAPSWPTARNLAADSLLDPASSRPA
jgi:hypothetical protein